MGAVKELAYETWRLHFACPVCAKPAASGPGGEGYEMRATRKWVKRVTQALTFAIHALRLISLVTPLPLPGLGHLTDFLPSDTMSTLKDAKKDLKDAQKEAKKVQKHGNTSASAVQKLQGGMDTQAGTADPVEISLDFVTAIREVLLALKESSPPKHTGLSRAVCRARGECAWVCAGSGACGAKFEMEGSACQKVPMVFK
jgi:hypothetical protein